MKLRVLILPLAVLFVIVLGALVWISMTPEYTIAQVLSAATKSDYVSVTQYVDMNAVVHNIVEPQTTAPKQPEPSESGIDKALDRIGQGIMMAIKPKLTRNIKEEVQREIESGRFAQYDVGNTYLFALKLLTDTHKTIHIRNKQPMGNLLKLSVVLTGPNAGQVDVKLSKTDSRWVIKALEPTNIRQLIDLGLN